jgi:hypothetical protein
VIGTRCGKIVRMESMSDKLGIFLVWVGLFIICMGLAT